MLLICSKTNNRSSCPVVPRICMTKPKLTVNETKTRVCKLPEDKFDFLGHTFGRCYSLKTGRAYIGTVPSRRRVKRICERISELTGRDQTLLDQATVIAKLNRVMTGWGQLLLSRASQQSLPSGG
jgi:RNA-directed DNA polymerase